MEKDLLIRVLTTNNRVVIPSFGAFLRKQQGDALVFSPFLKSDDGFLASTVKDEYGVSDDDARQMVAAFAEHIASVLRARSKFYIDGVGTLVVDDNGAVSFVMDTTRQIPPSPHNYDAGNSQPQPAPQPQVEPRIEPVPVVVQPVAQPQPQPQPVPAPQYAPRPVAPQPISAARQNFAPTPQPTAPQPQPVSRPVVPAPARPMSPGGFTRPASTAAPIAASPASAPTMQNQQTQPPLTQSHQSAPQTPPQTPAPRPAGVPVNRMVGNAKGEQRRPVSRQKNKNDVWLVVAIIAALVVIVLMVIGILTANEMGSIQL